MKRLDLGIAAVNDQACPVIEAFGPGSGWTIRRQPQFLILNFKGVGWNESHLKVLFDPHNDALFALEFAETAQFSIDLAKRSIIIGASETVSAETLEHLLHDQIFPRIIAHCGSLVLHAAAVVAPEGAILFLGSSGAGKSTLAASLHQHGCPLLGDDAVVIDCTDGKSSCSAVYRSLRLYPDSLETLLGDRAEHAAVAFYSPKRSIRGLSAGDICGAKPIAAMFLIEPGATESISTELMAPAEASLSLVEHSFWLNPADLSQTKARMTSAVALASSIPMVRLSFPREFEALPDVHRAVFDRIGTGAD